MQPKMKKASCWPHLAIIETSDPYPMRKAVAQQMAVTRVLVIEDDARVREVLEKGLKARGFQVTLAADGRSGIDLASRTTVDLVLLDLILPDVMGKDVLTEIRATKPTLPVIAVTALDDLGSKVSGLDAGADDYVTKPFSMDELVARIRARVRTDRSDEGTLNVADLTLDTTTHRAFFAGSEVPLSAREFSLLATFMRNPDQVLSREQLLSLVWDLDFDPGSNVVDVHVAALRRKLGAAVLETVRGVGYRLVPHNAQAQA